MTADESIMDSWLLYTQIWKIPGESLKKVFMDCLPLLETGLSTQNWFEC